MMGMAGILFGVGTVIQPMLIQKLMHEYGFRGCMAILAALNLHVLLVSIALHPVEWHFKVEAPSIELKDKTEIPFEESNIDCPKNTVW